MLISHFFSWFSGKPTSGRCGYAEIPSGLPAAFDDARALELATDLDLHKQNISDVELEAVAKELHHHKTRDRIQSINLSGNAITEASGRWLSMLLVDHPNLQVFDISHNQLTAEVVSDLAVSIETHPHLSELRIGDNNLGPDGVASLAEIFQSAPRLVTLDLGWKRAHKLCLLRPVLR